MGSHGETRSGLHSFAGLQIEVVGEHSAVALLAPIEKLAALQEILLAADYNRIRSIARVCEADRTGAWAPPGFGRGGGTSGPGRVVDFSEAVFIVGSAFVGGLLKGRIGEQQPVEFDPFPQIRRRNFGFSHLVFHVCCLRRERLEPC